MKFSLPALRIFAASLSPAALLTILTLVNILNYVDRGIVPGAFESIGGFIRADLGVLSTDFQVGLLQSLYIVGFAVASVSFGHAVHYYGAFQLVAVGLFIWIAAVLLSGAAPRFWVLALGRVLSGVGEGSFQTVVPPYIDDHAPPAKRGLWLAVFFCAIPVGTALGNVYGGVVSSALSWRWAFACEGLAMLPFAVLIWHLPQLRFAGGGSGDSANSSAAVGVEGNESEGSDAAVAPQSNAALAAAAAAVGDAHSAMLLASASPMRLYSHGRSEAPPQLPPIRLPPSAEEECTDAGGTPASPRSGGRMGAAGPLFISELKMLLADPLFMSITLGCEWGKVCVCVCAGGAGASLPPPPHFCL